MQLGIGGNSDASVKPQEWRVPPEGELTTRENNESEAGHLR